ncbi:hypothetical protein [Nocardia phage P3.1]|nr:hypothetical protein [Nocardia phage P3.1]
MTLVWRTENGKQPAVIPSGNTADQAENLMDCFRQGHRIVSQWGSFPLVWELKTSDTSSDAFLIDFSGDDTAIVLAHWSNVNMADEAYHVVTNRMEKLTFELREHRDRMQKVVPIGTIPIKNAAGPLGLTPEEFHQVLKKPMQVLPLNDVEFEESKVSWDTPGTIKEVDDLPKISVDFSAMGAHETPGFRNELRQLLNKHSKDTETGMPDFILASLIAGQLESLAEALKTSEEWKRS